MLRVHPAALKHGCSVESISHALDYALYAGVVDEDHDPPKLLIIGPDNGGNLLELFGGEFANGDLRIWHAMACRTCYLDLLPSQGGGA